MPRATLTPGVVTAHDSGSPWVATHKITLFGLIRRWWPDPAQAQILWLVLAAVVGLLALYRARAHFRRGEQVQAALVIGCASTVVAPIAWPHYQVWMADPLGAARPGARRDLRHGTPALAVARRRARRPAGLRVADAARLVHLTPAGPSAWHHPHSRSQQAIRPAGAVDFVAPRPTLTPHGTHQDQRRGSTAERE